MLYKVEAGKAEYLLHVLKRDRIDYTQSGNVVFNLPDDIDLDELEEDIKCEEQRQKTQAKIPVYSKRTLENKELREKRLSCFATVGSLYRLTGKNHTRTITDCHRPGAENSAEKIFVYWASRTCTAPIRKSQ